MILLVTKGESQVEAIDSEAVIGLSIDREMGSVALKLISGAEVTCRIQDLSAAEGSMDDFLNSALEGSDAIEHADDAEAGPTMLASTHDDYLTSEGN